MTARVRRPFYQRVFAAVIGLWVLFIISGPTPVHGCAVHDWMGHAGAMPMHGSMSHGHHDSRQHRDDPASCTCIGSCSVIAAVDCPLGRLVAVPVVPVTVVVLTLDPTQRVAPTAAPDVLLPPPLGPPGA